jgi:hypothetical protein
LADEYSCAAGCTITNTNVFVAFASGTPVVYSTKHYLTLGSSSSGYNYVIQDVTGAGAALLLGTTAYISCAAACAAEGEPVPPPTPPPPTPTPTAPSFTAILTGVRKSSASVACDFAWIALGNTFYVDGTSLYDSNYMALNSDGSGIPTNGWYSDGITAAEVIFGNIGTKTDCGSPP